MNKEIKSVLAMKPKVKSKARAREVIKIISTAIFVLCFIVVGLVSCGNTVNTGEVLTKPTKQSLQAVKFERHEVKHGDTLLGIALKFANHWQSNTPIEVVAESIKEKNSHLLINGYLLQAGTILEIPIW